MSKYKNKTRIFTPTKSFVSYYPEAIDFANTQLFDCMWKAEEPELEKDIQDVMVNLDEAERHNVLTRLKLFTLYEQFAGKEFWSGVMMKRFPRPDLCGMFSAFGMMELSVHLRFYSRINELLNLHSDSFYEEFVNDPELKQRIDFIEDVVSSKDELLSTAAFSLVEGVILYTSFAYFKHFQANGKNKMMTLVRGINFSAVDENLHALGGAYVFQKAKGELIEAGLFTDKDNDELYSKIVELAHKMIEHEDIIIDKGYSKGSSKGITAKQEKNFARSRVDLCLQNLGYPKLFNVEYNPIADWFYPSINNYALNDFFTGVSREYSRNWNLEKFDISWEGIETENDVKWEG